MRLLYTTGDDVLARVFVLETSDGARIECVESVQPPLPRERKWVLIVSTLKGCPVGCPMCDAGGAYAGRLSEEEILAQIDFMVRRRYPSRDIPAAMWKIQFARMGDPAFNDAVLHVLERLPERYPGSCVFPSISTVAPANRGAFLETLLEIKNRRYPGGRFQMQFSIHSTDESARQWLIPTRTWSLEQIAEFGDRFHAPGDRKITLNFAPPRGVPIDPEVLARTFSPERFLVKLTPVNPTHSAARAGMESLVDPADPVANTRIVEQFRAAGFDTILSIGELRENDIGSNCGMYVADSITYSRLQSTPSSAERLGTRQPAMTPS